MSTLLADYQSLCSHAAMLAQTWAHLPINDQIEQIEAHLESDGYSDLAIRAALEDLELL